VTCYAVHHLQKRARGFHISDIGHAHNHHKAEYVTIEGPLIQFLVGSTLREENLPRDGNAISKMHVVLSCIAEWINRETSRMTSRMLETENWTDEGTGGEEDGLPYPEIGSKVEDEHTEAREKEVKGNTQ